MITTHGVLPCVLERFQIHCILKLGLKFLTMLPPSSPGNKLTSAAPGYLQLRPIVPDHPVPIFWAPIHYFPLVSSLEVQGCPESRWVYFTLSLLAPILQGLPSPSWSFFIFNL